MSATSVAFDALVDKIAREQLDRAVRDHSSYEDHVAEMNRQHGFAEEAAASRDARVDVVTKLGVANVYATLDLLLGCCEGDDAAVMAFAEHLRSRGWV